MPIYDIAGLKVQMDCGGRTEQQAQAYLAKEQENVTPDITVSITPERIAAAQAEHPELNGNNWEYMLSGSDFYTNLLRYNGILLHSSCVVVDGVAYAFSADSGTGKSTHTKLWLQRFGDRAYMLNDDKPAIRCINGTVYACGTPWSGKHDRSTPAIVPLGAIVFLERSEQNWIRKADTKKAVFSIFSQTVRQLGPVAMERLFDVVETLFDKVPLYELGCNISEEAAALSYETIKRSVNDFE